MFKNQKVLVTGGTGMIGRQLVDLLLEREAEVHIVSLDEPTGLSDKVNFIKADLTYFDKCADACQGMDYVFNLVGVKGSPKMCQEQPADFMVPMLQFNTNMMEAARRANVKWFLFTSSVGVYHPAEVFREDDVWKTFPSKNDRFAGWAKRIGELQAQAYSIQYGWNCVSIVRPANVYGPYDNFDPENAMVIPSLIRKAFENDTLEVWGDGSSIRDFIHSKDVALGMLYMVENGVTEPVNLGSGTGVTIKTVVEKVVQHCGKELKVEWDTTKPTGDERRVFDTTRAASHGFNLTVSIEEGIRDTIRWFRENREIVDLRHNAFTK
jgi:GDP-L-fucose synthase|tara:strand:- start:4524 stop:5492 length:969 start_codon:yes stop_codon:yes gene_type:complete